MKQTPGAVMQKDMWYTSSVSKIAGVRIEKDLSV